MPKTRHSQLSLARRSKSLVRFARPFEQRWFTGYLLDVGPKFFLLAVISTEGVRFEGFSCLRMGDVRDMKVPSKYFEFVEAAQKKLGEPIPKKPAVLLASLRTPALCQSAIPTRYHSWGRD